jgi:hypothetical protein
MSKVYENNMSPVRGQLLQSGSKLVSDLSTNMANKADKLSVSIVGPFRRGPEKVSSFIARNVVRNPILVQKFISFFVAFLNRNFFGKTYISNTFIVNGKIMNGAAAILDKLGFIRTSKVAKALAPTPDGLAARVSSAFMASAMFYWLRVLQNEELAGGGGNPNLKIEQKGMEEDAKVAEKAAAISALIAAQIAADEKESEDGKPEPVGLGEAATQTAASLRNEAKKTTNPALKEYIDSVQEVLDKLAKELQSAAGDKKAGGEAKKKAAAALAAQAAAAQKAAQKKLELTQKKSPSVNKVPPGAADAAKADTKKANDAAKGATQQAAEEAGLDGSGSGGGAGRGDGPGIGDGTTEGMNIGYTFLNNYLEARKNKKELSAVQKQLPEKIGDKIFEITKNLDPDWEPDGFNSIKEKPAIWLRASKYAKEKDLYEKIAQSNLKDQKNIDEILDLLNGFEKSEEYISHTNPANESIQQYRDRVLNERFNKLVKGFAK